MVGFVFNYGWCIQFFLVFLLIKSFCFVKLSSVWRSFYINFHKKRWHKTLLPCLLYPHFYFHQCYLWVRWRFFVWMSNLICCEWLVFWCFPVIRLWWIKLLVSHLQVLLETCGWIWIKVLHDHSLICYSLFMLRAILSTYHHSN